MWQDAVFAIGSVMFIVSLLPSFFARSYPDSKTSFLTFIVLTAYTFAQFSMEFIFAGVFTAVLAFEWFVLGVVKQLQERRGLFWKLHIGRCNECPRGRLVYGWCDTCGEPDTHV